MLLAPQVAGAITVPEAPTFRPDEDALYPSVGPYTPPGPAIEHQVAQGAVAPSTGHSEANSAVMARIAACESGGDLHAQNPATFATGKYQFLQSSWAFYGKKHWGTLDGRSIYSERDQDDLAYWVVSQRGYTDWKASRSCWGGAVNT